MKISEIDTDAVAEYLRIDEPTEADKRMLDTILQSAKAYVSDYTGIPQSADKGDSLDSHDDFWPVIMVLCQDMYDNRSLYVEKGSMNQMVASILDMHSVNLV